MGPEAHERLRAAAGVVLDQNWLGHATKPAPHLYPHQWSWDSMFVMIGNSRRSAERGITEFSSLFAAQWSNGLVPHMVFDTSGSGYFPSAESWGSADVEGAPAHLATSGICQPPVHATAVRRFVEQAFAAETDAVDPRGLGFLRDAFEPLAAWHDYLHRDRAVGSELVEIWHPWESGMDNSPAWDGPMAALTPRPDEIPEYRRVDTSHSAADDRPTDLDYDRYMYLVEWLRRTGYQPEDPTLVPFRVRDVLFNSLLVQADRDLAWIAKQIGAEGARFEARSRSLATAINDCCWSDDLEMHVSIDAVTDRQIEMPIAGGLSALLADPPPDRIERIVATIQNHFAVPIGDAGILIPTVPVAHSAFESTRYWRGPVWVNIMWLVAEGLDRGGSAQLASKVRSGVLDVVTANGFAEYFDPLTGEGRGSDSFSWTAALLIDLLAR